jgi:hypothetical protein
MRFKRTRLAAVLIAASAIVMGVSMTTPAYANGTGNQWYYQGGWLNAWNGGPWVKIYYSTSSGGGSNDDFTLVYNHDASGWQLEFTGNGASHECIGDAYNDPNQAQTSLNPCGFTGGEGWGTLFDVYQPCGPGSYAFKNRHWTSVTATPQYLGPGNFVPGTPWWLNNNAAYCFKFYPPA